MELPGAWEPPGSSGPLQDCEGKSVFLMETKLQSGRIEYLKSRLGFDCLFVVDNKGRSGGLALLCQEAFQVSILNYSRYHINVVVHSDELDFSWKFVGFYSNLEVCKRRESWALLCFLEMFSPLP